MHQLNDVVFGEDVRPPIQIKMSIEKHTLKQEA